MFIFHIHFHYCISLKVAEQLLRKMIDLPLLMLITVLYLFWKGSLEMM